MVSICAVAVLQPAFHHYMLWAGNGAWLPLLVAPVFGIVYVWLLLKLAQRFPQQSIAEYAPKVLSPILGYPLVLVLIGMFFLRSVFALRNMSEFFVGSTLPETPISAVLLVMLFLVGCALWAGLEGLVRFNELATPIIIGAFLLVLASNSRLDVWNFMPLLNKGFKGLRLVFQSASSDLSIVIYMLFIYPFIADPQRSKRFGYRHITAAGLLLLAIYLHTLLVLGSSMGEAFTWPFLVVTENIGVLERGEALFMIVWMFAAFVKISFCLYVAALGVSQMIPKLPLEWVGIALLPLTGYVALLADDLPSAVISYERFNQIALVISLTIPLILLATAALRQKGELTSDQDAD